MDHDAAFGVLEPNNCRGLEEDNRRKRQVALVYGVISGAGGHRSLCFTGSYRCTRWNTWMHRSGGSVLCYWNRVLYSEGHAVPVCRMARLGQFWWDIYVHRGLAGRAWVTAASSERGDRSLARPMRQDWPVVDLGAIWTDFAHNREAETCRVAGS